MRERDRDRQTDRVVSDFIILSSNWVNKDARHKHTITFQ